MFHPIRRNIVAALGLVLTLGLAQVAFAAHPIYRASLEGPALDGYDTVAYFTIGRAVRGSAEYAHEWRDTKWFFSSAQHKALFVENPEKYAPQFGGYCAYAASRDRLYKGHPEVFTIKEGRLYFNNNSSIKKLWVMDFERFIGAAKRLFPRLIGNGREERQ